MKILNEHIQINVGRKERKRLKVWTYSSGGKPRMEKSAEFLTRIKHWCYIKFR